MILFLEGFFGFRQGGKLPTGLTREGSGTSRPFPGFATETENLKLGPRPWQYAVPLSPVFVAVV